MTICLLVIVTPLLSACTQKSDPVRTDLILATTTSTQDTGLLDKLIPAFEKIFPYTVKTIAVGSGEALAMGRRGEADVLLVHSPESEEEFMAGGYGSNRRPVMHNWFVLVGPKNDPAGAGKADSVVEALTAISKNHSPFISRGDESGTYKQEVKLWKAAGIRPAGQWYVESGQGMGETLRIADQKSAYTLTDEGTYLAAKPSLSLVSVRANEKDLKNPYTVIMVDSRKFPSINKNGAEAFSAFVTSRAGQSIIRDFGRTKYGKSLFMPDAGR